MAISKRLRGVVIQRWKKIGRPSQSRSGINSQKYQVYFIESKSHVLDVNPPYISNSILEYWDFCCYIGSYNTQKENK